MERGPGEQLHEQEPPREQQTWKLASGETVRDRLTSHLHGDILPLLADVFRDLRSEGRPFIITTKEFDEPIGTTVKVETRDGDEIVYAQRLNRKGLTRFVKNREQEPTKNVTAILKRLEETPDTYIIITAFKGDPAPPEPGDKNAGPDAVEFWNRNALIWGSEPTVPGTETTEKPW